MSERTTTAPATSTPSTGTASPLWGVAQFRDATEPQRVRLAEDMARCLAEGVSEPDYLAALATCEGDAAHYLASRPDAEQGQEQHNPASDTAAKAEQAARDAEAQDQAARKECQATLTALVKA